MDITFKRLIKKTIVVYMDDIVIFSKKFSNNLQDMKQYLIDVGNMGSI
jgi:hypothetical protein